MKTVDNLEAGTLIPKNWNLTAKTVEEVVFFGNPTIAGLIQSWRNVAYKLAQQIKGVDKKLKLLPDKSTVDIQEIIKQYNDTKLQSLDVERMDDDNLNLESYLCNDTPTFVDHDHLDEIKKSLEHKFKQLSEEEGKIGKKIGLILSIGERGYLDGQYRQLIEDERKIKENIEFLLTIEKNAEWKPAMPGHHPEGWFKVGGSIVYYIGELRNQVLALSDSIIVKDDFVTATILDCDFFCWGMGKISIQYNKRIHNGKYLNGYGGSFLPGRPEVMNEWEFEYLLKNLDFASILANSAKSFEGFNPEHFIDSLNHEKERRRSVKITINAL